MIPRTDATVTISKRAFQSVLGNLRKQGFTLRGPTVRDGAIVLDEIFGTADLPIGWTDCQSRGAYSLARSNPPRMFDFTVGPDSWKKFLNPPRTALFTTRTEGGRIVAFESGEEPPRQAFVGIRACDLTALGVQDRVFMGSPNADRTYLGRRSNLFILAVNCTTASANCFCTSLNAGPAVRSGFDLALTEIAEALVIDVRSHAGAEALEETGWRPSTAYELSAADTAAATAEQQITRSVSTAGLAASLLDRLEHREWMSVGDRCLSCGNCTMVCPTCFCTTVEDTLSLDGTVASRVRTWDSCHTDEFSHVHGGNLRPTSPARYRQWLTHKFATFRQQFGVDGCVGCGRCITWCPVRIDVTEELRAILGSEAT